MHRKIYREIVAQRIAARKLCRSAERAAKRSAKKSQKALIKSEKKKQKLVAQAAQKSQRLASKAARKAAKQLAKSSPRSSQPLAVSAQPDASSPDLLQLQPWSMPAKALVSLQAKLVATSSKAPASSTETTTHYLSTQLKEFKEGIEVKIIHTRPRVSAQSAAASPIQSTSPSPQPEPKKASHHLFHHRPTRAELINAESSLGRTLFGPIPAGHRREFFHDRENIWIWHEGWTETNRESRQMTIRYEVRPTGVYKKLAAGKYVVLAGGELENFRRAVHAYLYLIKHNLYHLV